MIAENEFTFRSVEPLMIDLVLELAGPGAHDLARSHARFLSARLDGKPCPPGNSRLSVLGLYWTRSIDMDAVAHLENAIFSELYRYVSTASVSRQRRSALLESLVAVHRQLTFGMLRSAA